MRAPFNSIEHRNYSSFFRAMVQWQGQLQALLPTVMPHEGVHELWILDNQLLLRRKHPRHTSLSIQMGRAA